MSERLCRVCSSPIGSERVTFDPAVDYSGWPAVTPPYEIHEACLPRALYEQALAYQRALDGS